MILNAGIGDSDGIVKDAAVGAIVSQFSETEYASAWAKIETMLSNADETRTRARAVAEGPFDLRRARLRAVRATLRKNPAEQSLNIGCLCQLKRFKKFCAALAATATC